MTRYLASFVSQLGPFHYPDCDTRYAQAASAPPSSRVCQVLSIIIPLERPRGPVVNSPSTCRKFLQDLPRVPVDLRAGVKAAGPVRGFRYKSGDGVLVSYHGSICSAESAAAIRTLELRRPVMPWPPLLGHWSRWRHLWLSSHQPGNGPGLEFERLRP